MAHIVPPVATFEVSSAGELEVFPRLRDDAGTVMWTALHSLNIALNESQTANESDSAIMVLGVGTLRLVVKDCSRAKLRREKGVWFPGAGDRGDHRRPLRQASEAMLSRRQKAPGPAARSRSDSRTHSEGYCTFQAFEGLEAPAVVVTGIETISTPASRALSYEAGTRPLQRPFILTHDRFRAEAVSILLKPAPTHSEVQGL